MYLVIVLNILDNKSVPCDYKLQLSNNYIAMVKSDTPIFLKITSQEDIKLKEWIIEQAKADHRPVSNWIIVQLHRLKAASEKNQQRGDV